MDKSFSLICYIVEPFFSFVVFTFNHDVTEERYEQHS